MAIPIEQVAVWVLGAGAVITALNVTWKFIKKISRLINLVETYGPVLLNIGDQFKKNGGNSLKDQIDRIEDKANDAATIASEARKAANDAHSVARSTHDALIRIDERTRTLVPAKSVPVEALPPVTSAV